MEFLEALPDKCPPSDADDAEWPTLFRLLDTATPGNDAFKSHAALGKGAPEGIDACRWASCSLVLNAKKMTKYPTLKNHKWAARLQIPAGAGLSKASSPNHVDFWSSSDFDMADAVVEVVEI